MADERTRLLDLMADRATFGIAAEEEAEMRDLLGRHPEERPESWEMAAAAVELALAGPPMKAFPEGLESKILEQARAFFRPAPPRQEAPRVLPLPASRRRALPSAGWWVAAASLLLAAAGWWPRLAGERPVAPAAETRAAAAQDLLSLPWTATEDPAARGVRGGVEWSTARQQGTLRFQGLPANDPARSQYQLWIFDAERDERYPVDGGVFDVPAGASEVAVPIDPKVRVFRPTLFAVTVEPPGGVVVSTRERLVLVAPVKAAT